MCGAVQRGMAAFCYSKNGAAFLAVKIEKRIHMSSAKLVFTAFFGKLPCLWRTWHQNYSELAHALFVHELLLTVIFALFRRRHKRKHRFWVHNIIKKWLQPSAYHNLIYAASWGVLRDTRWVNLLQSVLSRPPDILAGFWQERSHSPFPLWKSCSSGMNHSPKWKQNLRCFHLLLRLHPAHMGSGLYIFRVSNFAVAVSAVRRRIYGFTA